MWPVLGAGGQKPRSAADASPMTREPPPPPKRARLVEPLQHLPENVTGIVESFAASRRQ